MFASLDIRSRSAVSTSKHGRGYGLRIGSCSVAAPACQRAPSPSPAPATPRTRLHPAATVSRRASDPDISASGHQPTRPEAAQTRPSERRRELAGQRGRLPAQWPRSVGPGGPGGPGAAEDSGREDREGRERLRSAAGSGSGQRPARRRTPSEHSEPPPAPARFAPHARRADADGRRRPIFYIEVRVCLASDAALNGRHYQENLLVSCWVFAGYISSVALVF